MAGLYIHVPFCRQKCHYCNFFSLATKKFRQEFLDILNLEYSLTKDYLAGQPVETIYVGGGTPSLFEPEVFGEFMRGRVFKEITIEVNPEDLTTDFAKKLRTTGFNRVSMGVQSFFDEELRFMNRRHDAKQSVQAVHLLREAGFENISIDLIYGIPGSDEAKWQKNLEVAFLLNIPHISAYALTVEQGTPLDWMIKHQKCSEPEENLQTNQFRLFMKMANDHGFEQYEISNFAKDGKYSLHNANYWNGTHYLGLGPSAHSFNGVSRRWNISNLTRYLDTIRKGELAYEEEILSEEQKYNEYVMTSLRTMWGCSLKKILTSFGSFYSDYFIRTSRVFLHRGWLSEKHGFFYLTDEGKLFADYIASELFYM